MIRRVEEDTEIKETVEDITSITIEEEVTKETT